MALNREERKLLHQKSKQPTFGSGKPDNKQGNEGDISFRKIEDSGTVQYVKQNNEWVAIASTGEMPPDRLIGRSPSSSSSSVTSHGMLNGLNQDDHSHYLLIDGTRAMTGDLTVNGGDIIYGNAQNATISITATAHDTVGKSLTISSGDTTAGTTNNIAGGSLTFEAGQGKGSGAGGNIVFKTANASGSGSSLNALATALTISDDLSSTFAGAVIGTTIDATTDFTIGGTVITDATITDDGNFTIDAAGDVVVDAAGNEIYFKKNGSTTHTFNTSTGSITMVNSGVIDNSVSGRLFLLSFGNGVHIGDTTQFNTSGGMGHGDETLTYDHFVLRWDVEHTGSYVGQHIAGGQADYNNNYAMVGFTTTSTRYHDHTTNLTATTG